MLDILLTSLVVSSFLLFILFVFFLSCFASLFLCISSRCYSISPLLFCFLFCSHLYFLTIVLPHSFLFPTPRLPSALA
ncbi:hypothetical protein XELAEV_18016441mg [Xenopus laevis]|uniref:Uncharacterized protein n=1 Tax=Xenopus laevis TaxID=8355 RepID=A0A974DMG8_XENLA|nr:hypothetical protein XELAEV_18016441mg [Xenopus laevis]